MPLRENHIEYDDQMARYTRSSSCDECNLLLKMRTEEYLEMRKPHLILKSSGHSYTVFNSDEGQRLNYS